MKTNRFPVILVIVFGIGAALWILLSVVFETNNTKQPPVDDTSAHNNTNHDQVHPKNHNKKTLERFTLSGTVRQEPHLQPVENALVEISNEDFHHMTWTDSDGKFVVENIPMIKTAIIAFKNKEGNIIKGVWLTPKSKEETVTIDLPGESSLKVYVKNELNQYLPGATVSLFNTFFFKKRFYKQSRVARQRLVLKTNDFGLAHFTGIRISKKDAKKERYRLVVTHPDYEKGEMVSPRIKYGIENEITVTLKKMARVSKISGRLLGAGGVILGNRVIWRIVEGPDGKKYTSNVKTDQNGYFVATVQGKSNTVKNGVYQARISLKTWIEGYRPLDKFVTAKLKVGETLDIGTITLQTGMKVTGYVLDEKHNPIKDAIIAIDKAKMKRTEQSLYLKTNDQGYFETSSLGNALYDIFVYSKEYPSGTVELKNCLRRNVAPNTFNIQFVLRRKKKFRK